MLNAMDCGRAERTLRGAVDEAVTIIIARGAAAPLDVVRALRAFLAECVARDQRPALLLANNCVSGSPHWRANVDKASKHERAVSVLGLVEHLCACPPPASAALALAVIGSDLGQAEASSTWELIAGDLLIAIHHIVSTADAAQAARDVAVQLASDVFHGFGRERAQELVNALRAVGATERS